MTVEKLSNDETAPVEPEAESNFKRNQRNQRERRMRGESNPRGKTLIDSWFYNYGFGRKRAFGREATFYPYLDPSGKEYMGRSSPEAADIKPYGVLRFTGAPQGPLGPLTPEQIKESAVADELVPYGRIPAVHFPSRAGRRSYRGAEDKSYLVHLPSDLSADALDSLLPEVMCCGGNGPWGWSNKKALNPCVLTLLPEGLIDFTKFQHVILFEANANTKQATPGVYNESAGRAAAALAHHIKFTLNAHHAVRLAFLPLDMNGKSQTLTQFIASFDNVQQAREQIETLLKSAPPVETPYEELVHRMNGVAAFVNGVTPTVYDKGSGVVRSTDSAKKSYANITAPSLTTAGATVSGFDQWMKSPAREEYADYAYRYLGEQYIEEDGRRLVNTYRRGGVWPGYEHAYTEATSGPTGAGRRVWETWRRTLGSEEDMGIICAWVRQLKFTDRKMNSYPALYSKARGVGKGYIIDTIAALVGRDHCNPGLKVSNLLSRFNSGYMERRFIAVPEAAITYEAKSEGLATVVNNLVTETEMLSEGKGVDTRKVKTNHGLVWACNAVENIPMDGVDDRRAILIDCEVVLIEADGTRLEKWTDGNGDEWTASFAALKDVDALEDFAAWLRDSPEVPALDFASWRPDTGMSSRADRVDEVALTPIMREFKMLRQALAEEVSAGKTQRVLYAMAEMVILMPSLMNYGTKVSGTDRAKLGRNALAAGWVQLKGSEVADALGRVALGVVDGGDRKAVAYALSRDVLVGKNRVWGVDQMALPMPRAGYRLDAEGGWSKV